MKKLVLTGLLSILVISIFAQNKIDYQEGKVSFISSQNIYVKFNSTEKIKIGDTLFFNVNNIYTPSLIVADLSSISCICKPINSNQLAINDNVYFKGKFDDEQKDNIIKDSSNVNNLVQILDTTSKNETKKEPKSNFTGKLSASSYASFLNKDGGNFLRMRYVMYLKADNINKSKFSTESYISFTHTNDDLSLIKQNVFYGLKIYNLSIKYDATKNTSIALGRKYNNYISNLGAIDGIQIQQKVGHFSLGAIAGTRPDHFDYGFNPELLQFGAYVNHSNKINKKAFSSTFAVMEQRNKSFTDRRFMYFQHNNTLLKNLYTFVSFEMDLYKVLNNVETNSFDLSSLYLSLRYKISKKISIFSSYDKRNNIIYYETYKSILDKLLEQETRQGFSGSVHYKMFKWANLSLRGTYRFTKSDAKPSQTIAANLSLLSLPIDGLYIDLSYNYINTSYLKGSMSGVSFNYYFVPAKLNANLSYRLFIGTYNFSDIKTFQHIPEIQISREFAHRISLSVSFDAQFEKSYTYNRAFLSISKRF